MVAEPTPYRFTREAYYRMGELGLFTKARVELLDGTIITMPPQTPLHAGTIGILTTEVILLLRTNFTVRTRLPIVLNHWSEPEPDLAICQFDPGDYENEHPTANNVLLVIEVADVTLDYDRNRKVPVYASSNIPEYWIVNLVDRRIEVFTDPDPAARHYRQERFVVPGDILLLPGGISLAAADIL